MGKGKVGVATSIIVNTKKVSAIECDCKKCHHSVSKNGIFYCKYYDIFSPDKRKCVRYSGGNVGKSKKRSSKKKTKKSKK